MTRYINLNIVVEDRFGSDGNICSAKATAYINNNLEVMTIENGKVIYSTLWEDTQEYNDTFDMLSSAVEEHNKNKLNK
ncbi:hypothetical protein E4630_12205 [Aeromonas hydrophila]|uniref:hypothetical protein n=1 Tax=Aeromonas TaxID=642 RepID=UPI00107ECDB6|nr:MULTISPECIES: hypothetical protein [Aeromonas]QBX71563.1 hypothetical protein E4625_12425 [Aeromonas hydrophila]QBX76263.1 hypothetical protein E4630_12205 [Aeromonas hydrophila]